MPMVPIPHLASRGVNGKPPARARRKATGLRMSSPGCHQGSFDQGGHGTEGLAHYGPTGPTIPSGGFNYMLNKLRERAQDEKGFTLIELLVVILIIGILAAIALPAFLNQREKAQDAEAKSGARTVQTAMETYYTDNQNYTNADKSAVETIEPAIKQFDARLTITPAATSYTIDVQSKGNSGRHWLITRSATGDVSRTCTGTGCPAGGSW